MQGKRRWRIRGFPQSKVNIYNIRDSKACSWLFRVEMETGKEILLLLFSLQVCCAAVTGMLCCVNTITSLFHYSMIFAFRYFALDSSLLIMLNEGWNASYIFSLSVSICEGQSRSISCNNGETIRIDYALYGRVSRSVCNAHNTGNTNCRSGTAMSVVSRRCHGQRSCSLQAQNGWFGDPCHGIFKYLQIRYTCLTTG